MTDMKIDEMISKLDTACGMLLVPMMGICSPRDTQDYTRDASELIMEVSIALGELGENYEGTDV